MNDAPEPVSFELVKELVDELADLHGPARLSRLDEVGRASPRLRIEVESLLAHVDRPDAMLEQPVRVPPSALPATDVDTDRAEAATRLPERIGRYRVLRRLASGGMGTVWLAEQDHPRRLVAVKTIRRQLLGDRTLRRFRRESELLGRLQHRGIAQVIEADTFDFGDGPEPYFAMEYVAGQQLCRSADQRGLDTRARVGLMIEICEAVHHAHQKGVVHRDLKPDNILVDAAGQPKILDFGVARATDTDLQVTTLRTEPGQLIGTIPYMSPEQVHGDPAAVDTRSDVYALGVVLFELLTGELPVQVHDRSIHDAARVITEQEPTRLGSVAAGLRGDLETIAAHALEKDPERRYASADALAEDLRRHLAHAPILARQPSAFYQLTKFTQRHKGLVFGVAAVLLASVTGTVVSATFAVRAADNEAAALHSLALEKIAVADAKILRAPRQARRALDEVPERLRNWEWRYLDAQLQPDRHFQVPAALASDGRLRGTVAIHGNDTPLYAFQQGLRVHVVDLNRGTPVTTLDSPIALGELRLAASAKRLAGVGEDGRRLLVWDLESGRPVMDRVAPPGSRFAALEISADGSRVACEDGGGSISVLDVIAGAPILVTGRPKEAGKRQRPALSADGSHLAFCDNFVGRGGSFISVLECPSGAPLPLHRHIGVIASTFDGSGDLLAVGTTQQEVYVCEATTGVVRQRLPTTEFFGTLAFDGSGARLAVASPRETRIFTLADGQTLERLAVGADQVAISADGSTVALSAPDGGQLWHLGGAHAGRILGRHEERVVAVAFSPDSSLLASLSVDRQVNLWDCATGERVTTRRVGLAGRPRFVQFSRDGRELFVASGDLRFQAWRLGVEAEFGAELPPDHRTRHGAGVELGARVVVDGTALVPEEDRIAATDVRTGAELPATITFPGGPSAAIMAVSADGELLATGHRGGLIRLWHRRTGRELYSVQAHDHFVYALDFSPDGSRLASCGIDFAVRVWDTTAPRQVLALTGHENSLRCVRFSPDGTMIASCGSDTSVRLWDASSPNERAARADAAGAVRDRMRARVRSRRGGAALLDDAALDSAERRAVLRIMLDLE